ncbi:uncharacterized protein SCHCODRAFT_02506278 [Schizophyllum commune H4-8]|uniref:uncharacterized protein n=1 Tax=Schizophyllum commune (strain H4-8 / FGSC 9210) TaxID=578458 RepID=UPI002160E59C|nr:uncharacterized protein SCHCODRAFT_02506278 [Schizophyllum commune H4-8]KAI5890917.1 hypothetical protein SCHCODRAFT_02506278 [Schizophyllum commune H4-8]
MSPCRAHTTPVSMLTSTLGYAKHCAHADPKPGALVRSSSHRSIRCADPSPHKLFLVRASGAQTCHLHWAAPILKTS